MFVMQQVDISNIEDWISNLTPYHHAPIAGSSVDGLINWLISEDDYTETQRRYYNDGSVCLIEFATEDATLFYIVHQLKVID